MDENIEVILQALQEGDIARRSDMAQALALLETSSTEIVRTLSERLSLTPVKPFKTLLSPHWKRTPVTTEGFPAMRRVTTVRTKQ
jgi:hypothetical protein